MKHFNFTLFLLLALAAACNNGATKANPDPATLTWEETLQQAKGSTVHMMMWQGDPLINSYMQEFAVPAVREKFGITLEIAGGQGNVIVQTLMSELEAGKSSSELDLVWINGETFYQLRELDALYGPWTSRLPNARYVDFENPFIGYDFQQPVEGFECPWGHVQMALIYNSDLLQTPPRTREELAAFVKKNPGKFTFDTQFTGLTFLKSLLIDIAGGQAVLSGPFDEKKYLAASQQLWEYLRSIRPYLWKEGKTFPEGIAALHQMFANGEVWFTMSNNDNEVDNKVLQGLFPAASRAYVPDFGSIRNTHYTGIPRLSANKAGAMVVADFLISPEAQLKKQDPAIWGDGTVLDTRGLPDDWKQRFDSLPGRSHAPAPEDLRAKALQELAPAYMIRLAKDFRTEIIEKE